MKKMVRKTLTIALTGVMLCTVPLVGWAAENDVKVPVVREDVPVSSVLQMYGNIVNIQKDGQTLLMEVKPSDGSDTIIFIIGEGTYILDADTGLPMELEQRTGDLVSVYYGPAMTMSIPAQSLATAVFGNIKEDGKIPLYAEVESLEKLADGGVQITTDSGSRLVRLGKDMPITPYLTKNIVTLDDIRVGSQLVLWYDVMTLSLPAQANADKAILLASPESNNGIIVNGSAVSVNGTAISGVYTTTAGEQTVVMVPARTVAQALGYTVEWQEGTVTVNRSGEARSATYTVGSRDYGLNRMIVQLEAAPENRDGVTYVPLSFFGEILEEAVSINPEA